MIPDADDLRIPCQCAQLGRDGPGINQAGSDALAFCIKVMRLPSPSTLIPASSAGVVASKATHGHPKKLYREKPDEGLAAPSKCLLQKRLFAIHRVHCASARGFHSHVRRRFTFEPGNEIAPGVMDIRVHVEMVWKV